MNKEFTLCFCVYYTITTSLLDNKGECINDQFELFPGHYPLVSITKVSPNGDYDLCFMKNGKLQRIEFWVDPTECDDECCVIKIAIPD